MKSISSLVFLCSIHLCNFVYGETIHHKVGVIIPLTGGAAQYGIAVQNGFTLAKENEPELFSGIDFKFEDSNFDGTKALNALKKLITIDKVDLTYGWGAGPVQALAPVAERAKVPMIAATADQSATKDRKYLLRFNYSSEAYAKYLMEALRSQGSKKIAIITTQIPYYDLVISGMRKALQSNESIEVLSTVPPSQADFKSEITSFSSKAKSYDTLGVFLVTGQIATFYQQAKLFKVTTPTFGTDFFENVDEIKKSGEKITGAIYAGMSISEKFRTQYTKRFGTDTQIAYAGNAYDTALLIAKAFQRKTPDILASMKQLSPLVGVSGTYLFNDSAEGGGFDPQLVIKQISKKGISVLSTEGNSPG